jgi:hypothetical protein
MVFEAGALTVGGISIATIIVSKFKFYVKKNGSFNWACGCSDKPLIDDDKIIVKTVELRDVHVMYVKNKHQVPHHEPERKYEYENADEHAHLEENSCFKRSPFEYK